MKYTFFEYEELNYVVRVQKVDYLNGIEALEWEMFDTDRLPKNWLERLLFWWRMPQIASGTWLADKGEFEETLKNALDYHFLKQSWRNQVGDTWDNL